MSELALKLIAENKAKHACGEDARVLYLENCGLEEVPEEVGELVWLDRLFVGESKYNERIELDILNVLKFKNLKYLTLENLKVKPILEELSISESLEWLHIEYIYNFDKSNILKCLKKLKMLSIRYCSFKYLPDELGDLNGLECLRLSHINGILDFNPFVKLKDLRILELSFCGLKVIPKEIIYMQKLETLDLCHNPGISDFNQLYNLKNLKTLNLGNCDLCELLPDLTQDLSVIEINLENHWTFNDWDERMYYENCLVNLGKSAKYLNKLKKINIRGIKEYQNNILDISDFIYINDIEEINLSYCGIKNISVLENLKNLTKLNLTSNKICDITPLKKHYKSGCAIFVNGNPIQTPPLEIVKQGTPAILRYFEELEKSGTDQIHEAKLLLIGEGGAGKTTLCRKLFDPNAELPQEKDRTKGIDIHPLYFDIPGKPDKQFRLNIWDFAGQGKYQSAHSFFYTHRSLYVLVDDTRTLNENDAYRTLYNNWLQTAELFGGKSPVLVLHNEKDGCARTGFSLGGFQEHFGFVHGELFRINLGGGDIAKIEDLRRQIERQALALPHIGDTVPKTWVKVRDAIEIERQAHPYISAERYRALCEAEGIADPERQSDLSHYFHDLGVFLHFQDNPLLKRDVFLQNQWVTDAVYKILDDAQIAGAQRGRFTPADLKRLWYESTYRERRDELLALMLQFELCYQVQDTDTYICPQLLPGEHSISDFGISDFGAVTLEGSDFRGEVLQLRYLYVFMPKGLLYRLIVRLHRHIAQGQTAVWNAGVVLERAGAKAEITESLDRRTIFVRAVGLRAKELVTIINEELERLHAPFGERLKVTVRIPCNCRSCKGSQAPHFYDKTNLDNRLSKGRMAVECDVSFEEVKVLGLLEGVFAKNVPHQANDKLNLFISYSKHDKDYLTTAKKHLKLFERQGKLRIWDDTQLNPGEAWDAAIKRELAAADIILFLVSADLIATDYVWDVEMKEALARAQAGEVSVVPVIVRACAWESAPFGKYNALPGKGKPIASYEDGDGAWKEVVNKIETLLAI